MALGVQGFLECPQRRMLRHLHLVLSEQSRSVRDEQMGICEVDVPFQRVSVARNVGT